MRLSAILCLGLITSLGVGPATTAQSTTPHSIGAKEWSDDLQEGHFVYLRSGAPIILRASPLFAAALAPDPLKQKGPLTPPDGLELDPRGDRPDLIERGVTLFRVPRIVAPRGLDTEAPPDAWQVTLRSSLPSQPVFEHGAVLRIPSDEVIVAFDPAMSLENAKRLLAESWDELKARRLREFRPGAFICELLDASAGRAFEVSRKLAQVEGVLWAEPSFINLYLETPGDAPDDRVQFNLYSTKTQHQMLESKFVTMKLNTLHSLGHDVWQVAFDGHFEDDFDQWIVARDDGANRALPVAVKARSHDGRRSVFMSGKGLAANEPPDPYFEKLSSFLIGPKFNLSSYTEVYVELWFWARFEDPVTPLRQAYDFGRVLLYDVASEEYVHEHPIAPVGPTGDLTRAPGTDNGWRKLMYRVPREKLVNPLQLHVHFYTDELDGADGMFVDDIRVLYKAGDDPGTPFSHDPAALQQYAIMPLGQIAGWPASDDPKADAAAAWLGTLPEQGVIVALLDDGVEREHPDLAFWEPEKDDDTGEAKEDDEIIFPGEPVSPEDRHGTACAGVLGAIANNGIGIAGVAPGALLLPLHRGIDDISVVQAIDAAVEHGAHVLVIPWGWSGAAPEAITQATIDAIDAGTTVVAAAGDGVHRPYSDAVDYPCLLSASTSLICVGASSIAGEPKGPASADGLYWWSSAVDKTGPDLLAPGTWLHATDRRGPLGYNAGSQNVPSDWTDEFAGTGASACYVGGVAALMATYDPLLLPEELKRLITTTATSLPSGLARRDGLRLVAPRPAAQAAKDSAEARARESESAETAAGR